MRKHAAVVVAAMLFVTACGATVAPGLAPAAGPCMPPGVPAAILDATPEDVQVLLASVDGGGVQPVVISLRKHEGKEYGIMMTAGRPVMVDTEPSSATVPPWIDYGMIAERNLRATPGPCDWRKPDRSIKA